MPDKLSDHIPDPEVLISLEPDELGLRMLPFLGQLPQQNELRLHEVLLRVVGNPNLPHGSIHYGGDYPRQHHFDIETAIREAWAWLIGAALLIPHPDFAHSVYRLSRRAKKLAKESNPKQVIGAKRIPKDVLLPFIREDVWALFHRGRYDTAVFEAMKAVEVTVRTASKLDKELGVSLMRKAFDPNTGPLTDMSMNAAEREMRAHLFTAAIGSYKNPHSHRNVALDDPDEAAEIIMLANHLLRIVEARAKAATKP